MIFIVHSQFSGNRISTNFGVPEYSYYFVLQKFLPLLKKIGEVQLVDDPRNEVDAIYYAARKNDIPCLYLSFTAPQNTTLGLECPTVSVFAWEFDSIPKEIFEVEETSDWRQAFKQIDGLITHSNCTVDLLRKELGDGYPIISAPAPVWNQFAKTQKPGSTFVPTSCTRLQLDCSIIDSNTVNLDEVRQCLYPQTKSNSSSGKKSEVHSSLVATTAHHWRTLMQELALNATANKPAIESTAPESQPDQYYESVSISISDRNPKLQALPSVLKRFIQLGSRDIDLEGIVYTTVLNPNDGRKNWHDIVCAFCIAFRNTSDATLVLKLIQRDSENMLLDLIHRLYQLSPFSCRVLVIDGYLDEENYAKLIQGSSYAVNASHGEGQCLPLMEFMSAGKPAIAPLHTGMKDYLNAEVAFLVDCSREAALFPHDPRAAYRTQRYRINWESLKQAFSDSYHVAKSDLVKYQRMSQAAVKQLQEHCSAESVKSSLLSFLELQPMQRALAKKPIGTFYSPPVSPINQSLIESMEKGWFHSQSGELYKNLPITKQAAILHMQPFLKSISLFCSDQEARLFLWGNNKNTLVQQVYALEQANANYFRAFLVEQGQFIPLEDQSVDCVLLVEALQFLYDPLSCLKEARRVAKENAIFLITIPHEEQGDLRKPDGNALHHWSESDFKHLLAEAGLMPIGEEILDPYWQRLAWNCRVELGEVPLSNGARNHSKSRLIMALKSGEAGTITQ